MDAHINVAHKTKIELSQHYNELTTYSMMVVGTVSNG